MWEHIFEGRELDNSVCSLRIEAAGLLQLEWNILIRQVLQMNRSQQWTAADADVSNVVGHLCQDYLLSAADHGPVFQMGRIYYMCQ